MKHLRKVRFVFAILIIIMISHYTTVQVLAYSIMFGTKNFNTGQYSLKYCYKQNGVKDYSTNVANGIYAWNRTGARIYVTQETNPYGDYNIDIVSKDYGNTEWHGECLAPIPIIFPDSSYMKINEYYDNKFSSHKDELVAHELGYPNLNKIQTFSEKIA